jgi:hypothetical protein
MNTNLSAVDWEALWAPYDRSTYATALHWIRPTDVVLDIGAGDLRLARQMATRARKVYAVEFNADLLKHNSRPHPAGLVPILADARQLVFPSDVSVGVLLMRHCTHFRLYVQKLIGAGARRLITNARWRMGVECIKLQIERCAYTALPMGWFACLCGAIGFKPGPVEALTPENEAVITEVTNCPSCFP